MLWLPRITRTYVFLNELEKSDDLMKDSVEFFWFFCNSVLSPDEFKKDIAEWEERSPDAKGFEDPDQKKFMLNAYRDPDGAAELLVGRFENFLEQRQVPYVPDEPEPLSTLFIFTNLEAANLSRLLKEQAFSEKTVESFERAVSAFNRCVRARDASSDKILSPEHVVQLEIIGSFLLTTKFHIKKMNGDYEEALDCFISAYEHFQAAQTTLNENKRVIVTQYRLYAPYHDVLSGSLLKKLPWMNELTQQMTVDCFEAIRKGRLINDARHLAEICETMIDLSEAWQKEKDVRDPLTSILEMGVKKDSEEIIDYEGYSWDKFPEFWIYALSWAENQVTPSTLKDFVNQQKEQSSLDRLQKYFFGKDVWDRLPERARRSLISADQDLFDASGARSEAVLNELKVATEELLIYEFWRPLLQWFNKKGQEHQGSEELLAWRRKLVESRRQPTLTDFASVFKMRISDAYLAERGVSGEDRQFIQALPNIFYRLLNARNRAEHEPGKRFSSEELKLFFDEFVGVGRKGVITEIYRILCLAKP